MRKDNKRKIINIAKEDEDSNDNEESKRRRVTTVMPPPGLTEYHEETEPISIYITNLSSPPPSPPFPSFNFQCSDPIQTTRTKNITNSSGSHNSPLLNRNTTFSFTFEDFPDDMKLHILGFLNSFDYTSYDTLDLINYCRFLFVSKNLNQIFWGSIVNLIATNPHQMDVMNIVLTKIRENHPNQLLLLKNVGFWSNPGKIKSPITRNTLEILHLCRNIVRLIFGKGQYVMRDIIADDFKLLRSLQNLELIEVDHTDLPALAFTSSCVGSTCSTPGCAYCSSEGGDVSRSLIEHFPNLKSFRVRGPSCNPSNSILDLLKKCPRMRRIGIWGSGEISEMEMLSLTNLTEVTELILSSCSSSNNKDVFKVLVKMKLKHLGLFYSQNNNSGQDDDFRVLSAIPSLTSLHIGGWNLTNQAFKHLVSNFNLLYLSVSRAQGISREGISEIARNSTIQILRISACIFLRDFDLIPVVSMKQLQRLDLDNTKSITDNFLKSLSEKSRESEISEIYLMGIPLISDKGISYLENFFPLKTLVIKNCQNVTEESVKKLKENHMSSWIGRLSVTLDNSEYIQKQQQQQQQNQRQQQQQPIIIQPPQPLTQQSLIGQLQEVEQQVQTKLSQIEEAQPLQEEQGLQTAYQYQEQLQQLHNLLYNQQGLQQQLQQLQQQIPTVPATQQVYQYSYDYEKL